MLTGAPVINYRVQATDQANLWKLLAQGTAMGFPMTIDTTGSEAEHENDCGITINHAFAIVSSFELKDEKREKVLHRMVMIRNPRSLSFFSDKWNSKDTMSWSDDFVSQVPFGFNPLE